MNAAAPPQHAVVIDTNIVLDLLLFADPSTQALRAALDAGALAWLATDAMRGELQRVLDYPAMRTPLSARGLLATDVLQRYDRSARLRPAAPACGVRCSDPHDQPFIDLAVAHRARLLSKDKAVLHLRRRLAPLAVMVAPGFRPSPA